MQVRHATAEDADAFAESSAEHRTNAHAFYPASGWSYAGRRFGKVIDTANTEKESAS